ncbi:MAG: DUF4670 domain-containing protein [Flavobacteriales bacterium]|nr:DUF4670 domain-containing protein [Flavobacteriales bacterium]
MKPKITIDREPISSEEILARRNFTQVMSNVKLMQKPFFKSTWFISSVAATAIAGMALVAYLNTGKTSENNTPDPVTEELSAAPATAILADTTISYSEDSPCIHPPVPGAEKKYSTYTINNQEGATIQHPTGTKITIPKNSISDNNGNIVKGKVDILFREFHTTEEIILSGIPMTYDSAGTQYHFESAGMFDIRAQQNGNNLNIAPNAKIKIELASDKKDARFNFYELDTIQRNWVYLGKEQVKGKNKKEEKGEIITVKNNIKDLECDSAISANSNTTNKYQDPVITKKQNEIVKLESKLTTLKKSKPVEPKEASLKRPTFNLNVDPQEFPELESFEGTLFEVSEENNNFSREWYNQQWNDVKLSEHISGVSYKLDLTKVSGGRSNTNTLIVFPVFKGANLEKAQKIYTEKLEAYNKKVKEQEVELARKQEELKVAIAQKEEQLRVEAADRRRKEAEERARQQQLMMQNSGAVATGNVVYTNDKQFIAQSIASRTFSIERFGTYNSDCPQKLPHQRKIMALYLDGSKNPLIPTSQLYLCDKRRNLVYNYYPETMRKLQYDPEGINTIMFFDKEGYAHFFGPGDFKIIPESASKYEFVMRRSESKITDPDDVKKILSL